MCVRLCVCRDVSCLCILGVLVVCFVNACCGSLYCGEFYVWMLSCAFWKHWLVVFGGCVGYVRCIIVHFG